MAVYQITRITHRQGTSAELPSALDSGEIGITTDTGEIFFGAPTQAKVQNRQSYPYQNIKILTEFDVQRGITGDVYYHGPLLAARCPGSNQPTSLLPLFKQGSRDFAAYDFGLSSVDGTIKIMGSLKIAVHPMVTSSSNVIITPLAQCAAIGWQGGPLDGSIHLSNLDDSGQDSGVTWLQFTNSFGMDLILSVSGREWSAPAL